MGDGATERDAMRRALHSWRDSLLSLTGRNRLLNYRPTRTSTLDFIETTPDEVLSMINVGKGVPVAGTLPNVAPQQLGSDDLENAALAELEEIDFSAFHDHLFVKKSQRDVDRGLRLLATTATREYLDRGLSVLYLAFGSLQWIEINGDQRVSPLVFVPVELRSPGPKQPHRLFPSPEDAVVNPALEIKMREHGIALPTQQVVDHAFSDGGYARAEDLFRELKLPAQWSIQPLCILSSFMFAKEAMYRDLESNEDMILESALIAGLTGRDERLREQLTFNPADPRDIDDIAPPETTPLILDADSSQRVAIAATHEGRSFVLDGPPGTGKSQTIANIIATLMSSGKRVLFVSEKAVALDVVRDRLSHRGLGPLLFELHSHNAARSAVAQSLGRALSSRPSVTGVAPASEIKAKRTREDLTLYALAMNEKREPIGWSLFHALGLLAPLPDTARLPRAEVAPTALDEASWNEICDLTNAIEAGWPDLLQGEQHLWHGLTRADGIDYDLANARRQLNRLVDALDTTAPDRAALGLDALTSWREITSLTELWHAGDSDWRDLEWIKRASPTTLERARSALESLEAHLVESERLINQLGPDWRGFAAAPGPLVLPDGSDTVLPNALDRPTGEVSRQVDQIKKLSQKLRASQAAAGSLAGALGLSVPSRLAEHRVLEEVTRLIATEPSLRVDWLSSAGAASLHGALDALHSAQTRVVTAAEIGASYFKASVASVNFAATADTWHARNALSRVVVGPSRADKATVAPHTTAKVRVALAHIELATEWQQAERAYHLAASTVQDVLGWIPVEADRWMAAWDQLSRANTVVARIGNVPGSPAFSPTSGEYQFAEIARTSEQLSAALSEIDLLSASVGSAAYVGSHSVDQALVFMDSLTQVLDGALSSVSSVDEAGRRSLNAARQLQASALAASNDADRLRVELDAIASEYPGIVPDLSSDALAQMTARLEWSESVVRVVEGVTPEARVQGLSSLARYADLDASGIAWDAARDAVTSRFKDREFWLAQEMSDAEDAEDLLDQLARDVDGAHSLAAARQHMDSLTKLGLGPVIKELLDSRTTSEISEALQAAVITSWVDAHIATDARLQSRRPISRDALIDEFRSLDRALVDTAASRVLDSAIARRPSIASAQTALIQAEAQKKRRHIPVRDLIQRAGDVIQAIHPCFMMSPLAVSQYLPADIRFDYVIFDEASQVPPADAINCLYRASAVIAAGDQKQLPPTSFFAATQSEDEELVDEDDLATDYESLLDLMKSSGSYTSIGLRWHYRSRHESLIAYSNNSFYEDSLITFPSAHDEVPDAGVKLFKIDGIYRRSQGQDNPREAMFAAQRVIHHLDTRPGKSVGVVAMSSVQRDAIGNALDVLRADRPDLAKHFVDSRLDGIFIKSLEQVQGDERDVIIMSIGYGPDENGVVYRNFGPINKKGGERRLNVAVTRAKELMEVVSSMNAGDIGDIASAGGRHLRRYLDYAERGTAALAIELGPERLGTDSPFEDAVISSIRSWGYDVQPQVGVSGFRIDIGVKHPSSPGVFMLGVECDGAMYHSAQSARDRDRLRHDILVGLGWRIHHIWGTDWYRNRPAEEAKLRSLLEELESKEPAGRLGGTENSPPAVLVIEENVAPVAGSRPEWFVDYLEAPLPKLRALDWTESSNARHLVDFVREIAIVEAPVHIDLLKARLRASSDIDRVNKRALWTLWRAIDMTGLPVDGEFLLVPGAENRPVRTAGARSASHVHGSEFTQAVERLIGSMAGATRQDLALATSRAFGWMRTPNELAVRIADTVDALISGDRVTEENGVLRSTGVGRE